MNDFIQAQKIKNKRMLEEGTKLTRRGRNHVTDILRWRKKFGVLGPSTNTVVQPKFDDIGPSDVTNHYSRIYAPNAKDAVSGSSSLLEQC